MKHYLVSLLLVLQLQENAGAQVLRGTITNESGEPVPYVAVYIGELRQGTSGNAEGSYEIKVPEGTYTITFQSLGYSPVVTRVSISGQSVVRDIILPVQVYEIPEVRVSATGEDPAYGIMRKAIGMAPYYLNIVSYYRADVYLKGTLFVKKIPRLLQKSIKVEARNDEGVSVSSNRVKAGDVFVMESFNEIEFTAPDKYSQKVISLNSTFPAEGNNVSPMDFIKASFYEPLIANIAISPLSPKAFSYYRFRFMGSTRQNDYLVNKIQVIPKIKSQQLFNGDICIIDDLWCLQSIDLNNDNIAGNITIRQLYLPVQEDTWLPVSHRFGFDIDIMGVKAYAGYLSSVKYNEVKNNTTLEKPESVGRNRYGSPAVEEAGPGANESENRQKIEKILSSEDMSNRDMIALSRLMNRESVRSRPDSVKNNLDVSRDTGSVTTVAADAASKDTAFWAAIRPMPLTGPELRSIHHRDSLRVTSPPGETSNDSITGKSAGDNKSFLTTSRRVAFGHGWTSKNGYGFIYGGLLDISKIAFNTVDGFVYGQDFRFSRRWKNNSVLAMAPELKWAFSRGQPMWRINGNYNINGLKNSRVFFKTGISSRDISNGGSINPFLNSVTSLFFMKNYLKLYMSKYITLGYGREISNGLYLELSGGFDDRTILCNNTGFAFVSKTPGYSGNIPVNPYLNSSINPADSLQDHRHFELNADISFTPRQRYRIENNAKIPKGSDWPTFRIYLKHAINEFPGIGAKSASFDMIRFEVSKEHDLGGFSSFSWRFRSGGFLDNRHVPFFDFFHFNAQPLPLLLDDYRDAFRLPSYYSMSTPEFFGEVHVKYTTPYLLLKYLPGISKTLIRENLSLSCIQSRYQKFYTEIGYSISEFLLIGETGIYAGFDNLRLRSLGVRLVLRIR
jgi:hypothetical protein